MGRLADSRMADKLCRNRQTTPRETRRKTDGHQPSFGSQLLNEALPDGFGDRRCAVSHAHFLIDVLEVGLDRGLADF
jgi:hypothetical protein